MRYRYGDHPHPHLLIEELVAPAVYRAMRFPDERLAPGASWGLTSDDPLYAEVLRDPHWKALHDMLCGEAFVATVLHEFGDEMRRAGCLVDPGRARLTPFVESRAEKEQAAIATDGDPNDVFTRLDFQSKAAGAYREFVHLDWARRVIGGILFFSDADEEGLVGGETAFYRDRGFSNDRWCHDPELVVTFRPRHNTGVIFLNSNTSFHGPRAITALRGRRRWLYFTISSKLNVWPSIPRQQGDGPHLSE